MAGHRPYRILGGPVRPHWLLITCEHASNRIPPEYGDLGVAGRDLQDHIAWDIGAAKLATALASRQRAPAVLATVSRLVVDLNRDPRSPEIAPVVTDGRRIPGNDGVSRADIERRIARYHEPYHRCVDACMREVRPNLLLSIHSFVPELGGRRREFDMGVLFDRYEGLASELARSLSLAGLDTRLNEPYSGQEGFVYSVARHGTAHATPYLELEVNQALLRRSADIARIASCLAECLRKIGPRSQGGHADAG